MKLRLIGLVPLGLSFVTLLFLTVVISGCNSVPKAALDDVAVAHYHCPMHPNYVSDHPGVCPICGMRLVRVADGSTAQARTEAPDAQAVGRSAVTIPADARRQLGVQSLEVRVQRLEKEVRTVGRVTVDDLRVHHVHAKVEGVVERLHVDSVGAPVRRGESLLSLFSPDLVAAQSEYLLALRAASDLEHSSVASVALSGKQLPEAARARLRLWDISDADIEMLAQTGTVRRALEIRSEVSGVVTVKNVVTGMRVAPNDTLFDVVDVSRLWVIAEVPELEMASIREGTRARVTLPFEPRAWSGAVTRVDPILDPTTRTARARIEIANPDRRLKPEMFADVVLRVDIGLGIVLPEDAVIDAGDRQIVLLDRPDGYIEPRIVEAGSRVVGGVQVTGGLKAGDRVIASANFLLDSESSLRAALTSLSRDHVRR